MATDEPATPEQLFDLIAEVLPPTALKEIRSALRQLKQQSPSLEGDHCQPLHTIPRSLEGCQHKIRRLLTRMTWLRQMHSLQGILLSHHRKVEKENHRLKEENGQLRKALTKSKHQIQQLLGVKKQPQQSTPDDTTAPAPKPGKKKRGAPPGHRGNTRPIPQQVDHVEYIPPPEYCPCCQQQGITAEPDYLNKYTEDIQEIIKTVTRRRYQRGTCQHCGASVADPAASQGPPVVVGNNLKATLTIMRQQMGVSLRKLSRFCQQSCGIELSPSGVLGILSRTGRDLEPAYTAIEAAVPLQSTLHADETGWKMDGQRWVMWIFCNQRLVFFYADKSRGAQIPKTILGEDYRGLLHSDFYASYNGFQYTQKCLVHFLRDIRTELLVAPEEKSLVRLKKLTKVIIKEGEEAQHQDKQRKKEKHIKACQRTIHTMCKLTSDHPETLTLIKRVNKYQDCLMNFAYHPDAAFHNNLAERMIRPAVIFRKISFGNRTPEGARNHAILATVLETCRANNIPLQPFIKDLISSPPETVASIIRTELQLVPP